MSPLIFRTSVSLLCLLSFPLQAETIMAASRIKQVTLYPWGASIQREISVDLTPGPHDLLIADLPPETDAQTLQVRGGEGVKIGAVTLAHDRLPPQPDLKSPEIAAAEAEVKRLEAALRATDANIAAIRLKSQAAQEQITFLRGLGQTDKPSLTLDDLRALSRMVGEESLTVLQAANLAEQDALTAEVAREDDVKALQAAQETLAALTLGEVDHAVLTMAIESAGGATVIDVTTYTEAANWMPAYDLRLTNDDAPTLAMDRAVLINQSTGEDWAGVNLILSTARPAEQSNPSSLWPDLRRIGPPVNYMAKMEGGVVMMEEPSPVVAAAAPAMNMEMMGATVTYTYPTPVDIRNGVEALRLTLDTIDLAPELVAEAVPRVDDTAFLVADFTNSTAEPLLPGPAMLYLDGAMVGFADLPLLAAGADTKVGFGPIDGLRLTRTVPDRNEGDSGLISVSNDITETAVIGVENLTSKDWKLRLIDQVPYSEQEDLEISYTATPAETARDMDGQRGLLQWDFDLKAGDKAEITLETALSWPEGQVLQ